MAVTLTLVASMEGKNSPSDAYAAAVLWERIAEFDQPVVGTCA
jgi:hypothetical protein